MIWVNTWRSKKMSSIRQIMMALYLNDVTRYRDYRLKMRIYKIKYIFRTRINSAVYIAKSSVTR